MPEPPTPPESLPSRDPPETERDEVLSLLADRLRALDADINAYEPDGPKEEKLQLQRIRTVGYLAGQYRKLLKDTDIDEMQDELELLDKATELGGNQ